MIMRVLGEGQFEVGDEHLDHLNRLDDALLAALEAGDEASFRTALGDLLGAVRQFGTPLPPESLEPSDLILPDADATLDEVSAMLRDEGDGLIPGLAV